MTTTVKDVIDTILAAVPGAPLEETVDTLKSGQPTDPVNGVATTFIATMDVLQKSVDLGANFIITHEPTYYNHLDKTDWLSGDAVFAAKKKFIEDHHLTIWRFHDEWHMYQPDGIGTGFAKAMGWEAYRSVEQDYFYEIPPTPLTEVVRQVKEKLHIPKLRVVGPEEMTCRRIGAVTWVHVPRSARIRLLDVAGGPCGALGGVAGDERLAGFDSG